MIRGYASESLIVAGAYCSSFNMVLGITLLCLGCLGGMIKFGHNLSIQGKKEKLYEAAGNFITKIIEKPIPTVDFSTFTASDEIH